MSNQMMLRGNIKYSTNKVSFLEGGKSTRGLVAGLQCAKGIQHKVVTPIMTRPHLEDEGLCVFRECIMSTAIGVDFYTNHKIKILNLNDPRMKLNSTSTIIKFVQGTY